MSGVIRDPDTQQGAKVETTGHLKVVAKSSPYLHWYVEHEKNGFVCLFKNESFLTANTPEHVAYIKNNDSKKLTIDEVRCQVLDPGATLPIRTTYFDMVFDLVSAAGAGGTAVTPVNLNESAGEDADVTAYENDITDETGTARVVDRAWPKAEAEIVYLGHQEPGAIMLAKNDTLTVRYHSATDVSYIYVAIYFHFES